MKFTITLKDPDGVFDCLAQEGIDLNELPEDVEMILDKFVEFNEYVSIEFDTDTMEAKVLPDKMMAKLIDALKEG